MKKIAVIVAMSLMAAVLMMGSAQAVTIKMIMWTYGVETVQDNIAKFEKLNPGIKVEAEDISWYVYPETLTTRFVTGTAPEVIYCNDQWLQAWADAGWLRSLTEHLPGLEKYRDDMKPYVLDGLSYKGKIYGLPYYADTYVLFANGKFLEDAGLSGTPETWEDVNEMCQKLKAAGIQKYPLIMEFHKDEHSMVEIFYAMTYSNEPGSLFDEKLNPIFDHEGSAADQALDWLNKALNEWKIMDPAYLVHKEIDVIKSMQAGKGTFTLMEKYTLAELQHPGSSPYAGKFKLMLMPGKSHYTVGGGKFYALTEQAVKTGDEAVNAAGKLIEYFGGKADGEYVVAKRWTLEKGLGFGYKSLYEDPAIIASLEKWSDVRVEKEQEGKYSMAKEGMTPWFMEWAESLRSEMHYMLGEKVTPLEMVKTLAGGWSKLKKEAK